MTWVSVHAFHHGDLDALLLNGVRPVVDGLRRHGLADSFFFLRYWDGGPHLRVRVRTGDAQATEDALLTGLRRHLAEHPAPDLPEPHGYQEAAAALAELERLDHYLPTLMPNNSVHAIAYRPETQRYGTAMAAVERHFAESSRIALGLLAAGATREQRHTAALAALLLTRLSTGPRPPEPAEGSHPPALRPLLREVCAVADGSSSLPQGGTLASWWRSIRTVTDPAAADACAHLLCNRLGLGLPEERELRLLGASLLGAAS